MTDINSFLYVLKPEQQIDLIVNCARVGIIQSNLFDSILKNLSRNTYFVQKQTAQLFATLYSCGYKSQAAEEFVNSTIQKDFFVGNRSQFSVVCYASLFESNKELLAKFLGEKLQRDQNKQIIANRSVVALYHYLKAIGHNE